MKIRRRWRRFWWLLYMHTLGKHVEAHARAVVEDELLDRIPGQSTTHSLALYLRDKVNKLEADVRKLQNTERKPG